MPTITFEDRRMQAESMGYPAHLAHLVQYQYSLVLPDTQMCAKYASWYTQRCRCLSYGIMVMNLDNFTGIWGVQKLLDIEHSIYEQGKPLVIWHLVVYMGNDGEFTDAHKQLQPWFNSPPGGAEDNTGGTALRSEVPQNMTLEATGSETDHLSSHEVSSSFPVISPRQEGTEEHTTMGDSRTRGDVDSFTQEVYALRYRAQVLDALNSGVSFQQQMQALAITRATFEDCAGELTERQRMEADAFISCIQESIRLRSPSPAYVPRHSCPRGEAGQAFASGDTLTSASGLHTLPTVRDPTGGTSTAFSAGHCLASDGLRAVIPCPQSDEGHSSQRCLEEDEVTEEQINPQSGP